MPSKEHWSRRRIAMVAVTAVFLLGAIVVGFYWHSRRPLAPFSAKE